jgi:hypothetical protein
MDNFDLLSIPADAEAYCGRCFAPLDAMAVAQRAAEEANLSWNVTKIHQNIVFRHCSSFARIGIISGSVNGGCSASSEWEKSDASEDIGWVNLCGLPANSIRSGCDGRVCPVKQDDSVGAEQSIEHRV